MTDFKTYAKKPPGEEEKSTVNLQSLCRLCLSSPSEADLIGIFDNSENISLTLRIMACVSLEVQSSDALPKSICKDCRYILEKCYYFRTKSKNSDAMLKRHIRLINAGKPSRVFEDDFDEFDDDYTESLEFFKNHQDMNEKKLADLEAELKFNFDKEMQEVLRSEKEKLHKEETKRVQMVAKAQLALELKKKKEVKKLDAIKKIQAKFMNEIMESMYDDDEETEELSSEVGENDQEIITIDAAADQQLSENVKECDESYKMIYKNTDEGECIIGMERRSDNDRAKRVMTRSTAQRTQLDKSHSTPSKRVNTNNKKTNTKKDKLKKIEEIVPEQSESNLEDGEDEISIKVSNEEVDSEYASNSIATNDDLILIEGTSSEYDNTNKSEYSDHNEHDGDYFVEDDVVEEQHTSEQEEEGEPSKSDLERNKFEVDSITEAVRSTLQTQHPEININNNFELKIQKVEKGLTKVQVKTEDDTIILMEFLGKIEMDVELDENGERKVFKCNECPKQFARRTQLARHCSTHLKHKGFICDNCEKWCPTKSALERHRRVHTGEKPFSCEICGRAFIQKEILKRHMMVHSGIKPFKCDICGNTYIQRDMLRQHMNRKHTENPIIELHKCFLCPKSFCHASGLSRHLLIHSGKTYECGTCNKSFTDRSALKRHEVHIHSSGKVVKTEKS